MRQPRLLGPARPVRQRIRSTKRLALRASLLNHSLPPFGTRSEVHPPCRGPPRTPPRPAGATAPLHRFRYTVPYAAPAAAVAEPAAAPSEPRGPRGDTGDTGDTGRGGSVVQYSPTPAPWFEDLYTASPLGSASPRCARAAPLRAGIGSAGAPGTTKRAPLRRGRGARGRRAAGQTASQLGPCLPPITPPPPQAHSVRSSTHTGTCTRTQARA